MLYVLSNVMSFGFRVCFVHPGEGSLKSDEEFIPFVANGLGLTLKFSSRTAGVNIGKTDRFSISGGSFKTAEEASSVAEHVRVGLLQRAVTTRRGIDLGQQSLKSFAISTYGKQYLADLLKVHDVQPDHLGITVFRDNPRPKFIRMNMRGVVSVPAQTFLGQLSETIGRFSFVSTKAEVAAGIYAISHFVGRDPARFLLLFVSLETLFKPHSRSRTAQDHVRSLIEATKRASIPADEREAIASALSFQKHKSIGETGRDLAARCLGGETYNGLNAAAFFKQIYNLRNDVVHRGKINPGVIHAVLGETDRFVSDLIRQHCGER